MTERSSRPSARVLVIDETGSVLLCRITDALDTKPPVWITPGGGIEPGEEPAEAASRELREETGVVVSSSALGAPVAVCRGDWEFRGVPLYSEDWFFALRTERFDPTDDGLTDLERELHDCWRWWSPDEIEVAEEAVLPAGLASVVRAVSRDALGPAPLELPWVTI